MVMEIVQYGDPVLRKKCKPVKEVTDEIRTLATDMVETMRDAEGVGLAAPQVGIDLQLAIVDVSHDLECLSFLKINGEEIPLDKMPDHMPLTFINPELELLSPEEAEKEGCLSILGIQAKVKRPSIVKGKLPQLDGSVIEIECDGLLARAIQHETDHLNGILFIDRLSAASKVRVKSALKKLQRDSY